MSATAPIILGWDTSAGSRTALHWAATAAKRLRRPLRIVFVSYLGEPAFGAYPMTVLRQSLSDAERERILSPARELAEQAAPGVSIETDCLEGHPVTEFVELSRHAHVLVLGSRGRGRFVATLTGSTSVAVSSHAHCPVVVVRHPEDDPADANGPVIVGTDGSHSSAEAIRFAARYADSVGAALQAVCAVPDAGQIMAGELGIPKDYQETIRSEADVFVHEALGGLREDYPDLEVSTAICDQPPSAALAFHAKRAQLLVVGSHGRGGFVGMLLGSVSRSVLFSAPCPVAIVHHERATRDEKVTRESLA